ncbi:MAG: proline racemase family protein, partial [Bacteroidetes bacterium]|nr:proline racemase family protein [Bacteroidota bacterium]
MPNNPLPFVKHSINWNPPQNWKKVTTLDMHTEGEPLRVFLDGVPDLSGKTVLESRRYLRENHDYL